MKSYFLIFILSISFLFMACEHRVSMETTVHEDGGLEKVLTVESSKSNPEQHLVDSAVLASWQVEVNQPDTLQNRYLHTYRKKFKSVEEANADLSSPNDSLFRVTSTFKKKFRWFYTYIYYADTYHAINRLQLKTEDYFTQEDYAFIDRLPAEGTKLSLADSLYLSELENKMFDIYGKAAVEETFFSIGFTLIKKYNLDKQWIDTLAKYKRHIIKNATELRDVDDDYFLQVMDSLRIPLPYTELSGDYNKMIKDYERIIGFISWASDGKYQHKINMPWPVVHSNADSVVGNTAYWAPPRIKFLLKDYTMYAEARSLNYVTLIISIAVIGITVFLFWRKR